MSSKEKTIALPEVAARRPFPKTVMLIVVAELAERVSYTIGFLGVLVFFMNERLEFPKTVQALMFPIFLLFIAYFSPLIGSYIPRTLIGKIQKPS